MQLTLTVRGTQTVRDELARIGRQAPFALALALNHTANAAQREIRSGLSAFTLRRKEFVERTIYRTPGEDFATKTKFRAVVRINPARDVLAQHEDGGPKTARSGSNVAIPLPAVQQAAGTPVIPKRLRPSGLRLHPQVRKVVTPAGTFLVRNRPGRGRGALRGWRTEFLYRLKPSVPLKPRLRFHVNAQKAIDAQFERLALAAIDQAIGRQIQGLM